MFAEGLPGGKLAGAVTFLSDERPTIGLTTIGDRFDSLVFTLLHECAHLTLGHIGPQTEAIIDENVPQGNTRSENPDEAAANRQASEWLFPNGFHTKTVNAQTILHTAAQHSVHPSCVIGRIQHDTQNWSLHRASIPKVRDGLKAAGLI